MNKIQGKYLGDLRNELVHVQSGAKFITDAPLDNKGKGESFSPTDMVAGALGACIMTIMGIAAREHGFSIDGTTYEITKSMAKDPRRIAEINVVIEFPDIKYTDLQKKLLEKAAYSCPVGATLHGNISEYIEFNYKD